MSSQVRGFTIGSLLILTGVMAWLLTPTRDDSQPSVALDLMVPKSFGGWTQTQAGVVQVATQLQRTTGPLVARPVYDQVLMRTYRRASDGAEVMLALAYGREQRQEMKIHRPELCYYGQGYEVTALGIRATSLDAVRRVPTRRLMTRNHNRIEPVTYWIRIGDQISLDALQTRLFLFEQGLRGKIPDGILVRASSLIADDTQSERAFTLQAGFLSDLYSAMTPRAKRLMGGA